MTNSSPDQKMHANSYAALTHAQPTERDGVRTQATRDHAEIRRWATAHGAEPATGEATKSGPAKVAVNDGGVGIRFNFPSFAPFRPIEWAEWLDHFDKHELLFVFEEHDMAPVAARAYQLFVERGGEHGRDREDWFHAEREAQGRSTTAVSQPMRYQVVVASRHGR